MAASREPKPLSVEQTFRLASLAHLTAILNLFTVILGTLAALGLYLWLRRRSPLAAYHALQALFMQLLLWVGGGLLALGLFLLASATQRVSSFGICIWPLAFFISLIPIGSVVYGAYGAWVTHTGEDFKYYRAGDAAWRIIQRQEMGR